MNIQIKSKRFHLSLGMQSRLNFALKKLERFQMGLRSASISLGTEDSGDHSILIEVETSKGPLLVRGLDEAMGKAIRSAFRELETELIHLSHHKGWEEPLEKTGLLLH